MELMKEYLSSGNIKVVDEHFDDDSISILSHHCVFKGSDHSSKIYVVFDTSCKTSMGISLNDALTIGPVIQ